MICRLDGQRFQGRSISLSPDIQPAAVVAAIRDDTASEHIKIECPQPQPVHDHVGHIHPDMGLRVRTALARAGRTRGLETPHDEVIRELRTELDSMTLSESEGDTHRKQVAEQRATTEELQADVAAARGRVNACREHGIDPTDAERELEKAIRRLSEHRTSVSAASEDRENRRTGARRRRDRREQRLQLEDRLANRERDARRSLVDQLREEFAAALETVPETSVSDPFDTPPPVAALAIARLADLDAPVVLTTDRFDSAAAAADWLDASVIQI